ncbi:MAG: 1-(5-phosphoribosyl)-5-[(5-phosphoribosylamino)methylideneamino]imidazole-4-carboxamide isomerase [Myxococcota bacterium]
MELIPAIDLLNGKVVRLTRGDYATAEVYSDDPEGMAARFEADGSRRLHVVDLDGARDGEPGNVEVIASILKATSLSVQVGGGIRNDGSALRWLEAGASIVLGTAAVAAPEFVRGLCEAYPGRVIVALDAHGEFVATKGWQETSEVRVTELAPKVEAWGAAAILYTNISRDGTREGPDVDGTVRLQGTLSIPVIASGGIGALEHVSALRDAGVRQAVCGRALYSGAFTLAAGLEAAR